MSNKEQIQRLIEFKLQLEKINDSKTEKDADKLEQDQQILSILEILKDLPIRIQELSESKIGCTIGLLRKHSDIRIRTESSELIKKWKSLLRKVGEKKILQSASNTYTPSTSATSNSTATSTSSVPLNLKETLPETRERACTFLENAFTTGCASDWIPDMDKVRQLCEKIECALWSTYMVQRRTMKEYTQQLKTIKWNLSDPKNPEFNEKIYKGAILPNHLATMESKDMASEAKKKERASQSKEALEACQLDWERRNIAFKPGQFPCHKCKSSRTVYYQLQTRSADEPMTTFVTCLDCNNRWKF